MWENIKINAFISWSWAAAGSLADLPPWFLKELMATDGGGGVETTLTWVSTWGQCFAQRHFSHFQSPQTKFYCIVTIILARILRVKWPWSNFPPTLFCSHANDTALEISREQKEELSSLSCNFAALLHHWTLFTLAEIWMNPLYSAGFLHKTLGPWGNPWGTQVDDRMETYWGSYGGCDV